MSEPDQPSEDIFHPGGNLRLDLLTPSAGTAVQEAIRFARETRWDSVRSPHIFMGILSAPDPAVANWGERLGEDLAQMLSRFQISFYQQEGDPRPPLFLHREFLSDNVIRLLRGAHARAQESGRPATTPTDMLICMLSAPNSIVAECVEHFGGHQADNLVRLAVMAEQHAGNP